MIATVPRHGAAVHRLILIPTLTAAERLAWIAAREWPLVGAIAGLLVLVVLGTRLPRGALDVTLVAGYLTGFVVTRLLAHSVRRAAVRLEVVTVRR